MKKLSLFLGMVLAASFAMAQNSANISQTGLNHKSENTQKTGTGNGITVKQLQEDTSTKGYISEITQDGSSNTADVVQGGQPQDYPQGSNGGSSVEINQTGTSHDAKVNQNANPGALAKVTQNGVNQLTEVWNANNTGDATVFQNGQLRNNAY